MQTNQDRASLGLVHGRDCGLVVWPQPRAPIRPPTMSEPPKASHFLAQAMPAKPQLMFTGKTSMSRQLT